MVLLICPLLCACDSEDDSRPVECEAIVEACHAVDRGPGAIHDCHENAETTWTKDQCVANRTSCFAACAAAADGGSHD